MNIRPSGKLHYRSDIDGLRAVAATSVIAYHAGIPFVTGGFVGVDIFFVISGFLIGSIIYRETSAGKFSFRKFYTRRARRILPALFTVLVFSAICAWFLLTPSELQSFSRSATATILAVSNVWFWAGTNYFSPSAELNPLLMTWSLGVEEQFYLFLPPLLLIAARTVPRYLVGIVAAATLASFILSIWATAKYPTAAFFLLPPRAWELGAGVLLGIFGAKRDEANEREGLLTQRFRGILGAALIGLSVLLFTGNTAFPGFAALAPVIGTVLVLSARQGFINRAILSAKPAVFVGKISYSWYLWHWPLLSFARLSLDKQLDTSVAIVIVALSFGAATLSWRFIEQPFRTVATKRNATLRGYLTAAVGVMACVGFVGIHQGWPQRFSAKLAAIEYDTAALSRDPCLATYGAVEPNLTGDCIDRNSNGDVALIGDSHAAALAGAVREAARQQGLGFLELTKSSCPTLIDLTRRMPNHPLHERECASFDTSAFALVQQPKVQTVVVAGYWSAPFIEESAGSRFALTTQGGFPISPTQSRNNLRIALTNTIQKLQSEGKHVILVRDVPLYAFDPLRHVESSYMPARRFLQRLLSKRTDIGNYYAPESELTNARDIADGVLDKVIATFPKLSVVDPRAALCSAHVCRFADSSSVYYVDSQHLSIVGAQSALAGMNLAPYIERPSAKT